MHVRIKKKSRNEINTHSDTHPVHIVNEVPEEAIEYPDVDLQKFTRQTCCGDRRTRLPSRLSSCPSAALKFEAIIGSAFLAHAPCPFHEEKVKPESPD
ncbi:hypothetical protein TNCT_539161 [Trichonephila clavata]|uniref:Uncharacterized protein n=1 Tax=Trichonephila clavata TaxID=2740835 RepID=A0A8X6G455_TRICU|nr:hypothetical protein TNCT_539161 [Trichonephila clavata]